jgi:hypothetical protein
MEIRRRNPGARCHQRHETAGLGDDDVYRIRAEGVIAKFLKPQRRAVLEPKRCFHSVAGKHARLAFDLRRRNTLNLGDLAGHVLTLLIGRQNRA